MRPAREVARNNAQTYFVTSSTAGRQPFFRHERWARLFVDIACSYRPEKFLLHAFVPMPDHFHVLISPRESLEKAVQLIKGGFSHRARKEFAWNGDIWVRGFSDHRIRDLHDFEVYLRYIARNPVKAGLVMREEDYPYSSLSGRYVVDPFPRGLKPDALAVADGAAEAAPFQSSSALDIEPDAMAAPFQDKSSQSRVRASSNKDKHSSGERGFCE